MIRLHLPTEPFWIDVRGARIRVRPINTAVYEGARANAAIEARGWQRRYDEAKRIGAGLDALPKLETDGDLAGLIEMLYRQALARAVILEWEGVGSADGEPVEATAENIDLLMQMHDIAEAFIVTYTEDFLGLRTEGNVSGPSPNGILAAGPNTAPAAGTPISPAHEVSPEKTTSDAPTSSSPP